MRIGVDARELCGRPTGVGRYLHALLREWTSGGDTQHDLILYSPGPLDTTSLTTRVQQRVISGPSGTWWEQVLLPPVASRDQLDVFFAPAYTVPLRLHVPTVVTIHDLSYVAHPEWFPFREGLRRRWVTGRSAARARAVITVSQFSRREIVERLGVPERRVHVIPQGIDAPPRASGDYDGAPRVLYVGSIFNRRHVSDLVRAMALLARTHRDVSLDVVGEDRTFPAEPLAQVIAGAGLDGLIRWHKYGSEQLLADLYSRARGFAFLSEYEGFGLTPLEALAAGIPPVLADTAVAREVCGDAALYVPVGDVEATARALEQVLFDESTRARLRAGAPATLAKYDWRRTARETLAVIEGAATSG